MDRRTRICIWIILIGLANFTAYTILYVFIGGEAVNGWVIQTPDGRRAYELQSGVRVSRGVFLYSGVHSISIWPTVGAVLLAMLTLAKDRIVSSLRASIVRGRTMITILATIITMIIVVMTVWFILHFCDRLTTPRRAKAATPPGRVASVG
jgi:heme/copper-type cytochrome/quinol oxidase subunit 2